MEMGKWYPLGQPSDGIVKSMLTIKKSTKFNRKGPKHGTGPTLSKIGSDSHTFIVSGSPEAGST